VNVNKPSDVAVVAVAPEIDAVVVVPEYDTPYFIGAPLVYTDELM
jgi:hypothetical protein